MKDKKLTAQNFIMNIVENFDGKESLGTVFNCIGNDLFEIMELYADKKVKEHE